LDGAEVHAGHGYLLGQFLSPLTNTRTDEYGGDTVGRTKFLVEIIRAIREACGPAFLISVRLAVKDWDPCGLKVDEGVEIAKIVDQGKRRLRAYSSALACRQPHLCICPSRLRSGRGIRPARKRRQFAYRPLV
jgi:2,4-dienoyl-CoA reductase-like NADH-dependent reductase (Old Yellow Enzyme family)